MTSCTPQKFVLQSAPGTESRSACCKPAEPVCVKPVKYCHEKKSSGNNWGYWIGFFVIWWFLIIIAFGCFGNNCGRDNGCKDSCGRDNCRDNCRDGGFGGFGLGGGWWWWWWIWIIVIVIAVFWAWGGRDHHDHC